MTIRFGLGGFPEFLTPQTLGNGEIELLRAPSVSELLMKSKSNLAAAIDSLGSFNHVVFRLSGENPNELVHVLRIYGLLGQFLSRSFSVSFWTMDSHHLGAQEAKASKFFDHVFVAHKQYLPLFPGAKSSYLPCSFSLASSVDAADYLTEHTGWSSTEVDGVCAPFAAYPWQKRNRGYADCLGEVKDLGIDNAFFGVVRGGARPNDALIRKILDHKVVLNLSLSDDLNMRNFEALALNRILLTNRVRDHEILSGWEDNVVYLDENFENLRQGILESLNRTPKDISKEFLVQHGIEARVLRIVEVLSGHLLERFDVGFAGKSKLLELDSRNWVTNNQYETPHSQIALLAKSGVIPIGPVLSLLMKKRNRPKILFEFLTNWSQSFGFYFLKSTIGRSAFLRAVFRILS